MQEVFATYPTIAAWTAAHPVKPTLIYRDGQARQLVSMTVIASRLQVPVRYPSTHTSKSVPLPVAAYLLAPDVVAFVRDNFYGVAVAVQSTRPLPLTAEQLGPDYGTCLEGIWGGLSCDPTPEGEAARVRITAECEAQFNFTPTFDEIGKYPLTGLGEDQAFAPGKLAWAIGVRGFGEAAQVLRIVQAAAKGSE